MAPTNTILIIDQDVMIVTLLVELLTDEGYSAVGMARDAVFAAGTLALPALVLLDVDRSDDAVIDVLVMFDLASIPVVLLTTTSPDTPPQRVFAAANVLYKPFDFDAVLRCVAQYMRFIDCGICTCGAMR